MKRAPQLQPMTHYLALSKADLDLARSGEEGLLRSEGLHLWSNMEERLVIGRTPDAALSNFRQINSWPLLFFEVEAEGPQPRGKQLFWTCPDAFTCSSCRIVESVPSRVVFGPRFSELEPYLMGMRALDQAKVEALQELPDLMDLLFTAQRLAARLGRDSATKWSEELYCHPIYDSAGQMHGPTYSKFRTIRDRDNSWNPYVLRAPSAALVVCDLLEDDDLELMDKALEIVCR